MANEQTASKRTAIVKTYEVKDTEIHLTFMNDRSIVFDFAKLNQDLRKQCGIHGLGQKVRDNFAGVVKDAQTDNVDPVDLAYAYSTELYNQLYTEEKWNATRAKGEPRETPIDVLAQAVTNIAAKGGKTLDVAKVRAWLEGMAKDKRAEVSKAADVKAEIARIRANAAAPAAMLDLTLLPE